MQKPAFSNSMEDGNFPTDGDNGSNGAGDAPAQSIGGNGAYVMGSPVKVNYPLPPDPNAPPGYPEAGAGDEISDFGLNENVEVGHKGCAQSYGLAAGETNTGGSNDGNLQYGVENAAAGGGKDRNITQ